MKSNAAISAFIALVWAAGACAGERQPTEAAYLQFVFTKTAEDCANRRKVWSNDHPQTRKGMAGECFLNVTLLTESSTLPAYFLQLTSTAAPLSQPAGADLTLTYKALGPMQLAKDQSGTDPRPAGTGPAKFYQLMVFTEPMPGQDAAFNDWYDREHVPALMHNAGFISGQRFILTDTAQGAAMGLPPYLVVFTLRSGDLKATKDEINARLRDGRTHMSEAFNRKAGTGIYAAPL